MPELECRDCFKMIEFPKDINPDKYKGDITCKNCYSKAHVKYNDGQLEEYKTIKEGILLVNGESYADMMGRLRGYKKNN